MANTTIQLKKSATPSATPSVLANGELAINYADGKIFYKNATGQIVSFSAAAGGNYFGTVNANNTLLVADTTGDILGIYAGNNITISADAVNDTLTIDAVIKVPVQTTAPSSPVNGSLWWNSFLGRLFIYYTDGDSNQWVEVNPSGGSGSGTTSSGDPAAFAQANAAYDKANAVALAANSYANSVGVGSNNYANATFTTIANGTAAFAKANAALANSTGTFQGDLRITANLVSNTVNSMSGLIDLGPGSRPSYLEGRIYYDNVDKSLTVLNEESNFAVPLGQKEYVRVYNNTGTTISKGKPVYSTGYHTTTHHHPTIALADASNSGKYDVLGLTAADIPDASHGYVITRGWIGGIDTSALTAGQRFHLGFASPGSLVTIAPEYPNYPYDIGYVVVSDATNGYLYIDRQSHTQESIRVLGPARVGGDMTVEGDFTVLGTQTVTSTSSLAVGTQYIYLSAGDSIPNSNITFTGSGLNDLSFKGHYEGVGTTNFYVKITGSNATGQYFSWSYNDFATTEATNTKILYQTSQLLSNGISAYFEANTGHTVGDKWNASVTAVTTDAGFVTNHTDPGKYTHAGLFRDATDGVFKFFNTYDPEPAGNIDIANTTFSLGNVQVLKVTAQQIFAGSSEIGEAVPAAFNNANLAFDKANSANLLAFNTGIGANNWANTKLSNTSGVSFAGNLFFPTGCVAIGISSTNYPVTIASGAVTPLTGLAGALLTAEGSVNGVNQFNIRNAASGASASSDLVATTDDGSDTTNFIDLGINNTGYNAPAFWTINGPRDGYLYMPDGNLSIGVANTTATYKFVNFFVGGALAADEVMRIQDSSGGANVGIGRTNPAYKLDVVGTINASSVLINQVAAVANSSTTIFAGTSNNTTFVGGANSTEVLTASITYVIDGGGNAISTGQKGHLEIPFGCTINQWTMLLDQTGSANVEIWKAPYAAFPPVAANTINAAGFVVTSGTKGQGTVIGTTTINAGDILAYNVATASTTTRLTIALKVTKT